MARLGVFKRTRCPPPPLYRQPEYSREWYLSKSFLGSVALSGLNKNEIVVNYLY
jgi:hypothetical protein